MTFEPNFNSLDEKLRLLAQKIKEKGKDPKPDQKSKDVVSRKKIPSRKKENEMAKRIPPLAAAEETTIPLDDPKMVKFLDLVAEGGRVCRACEALEWDFHKIRNRSRRDPKFRELYFRARSVGVKVMEEEAVRRAYEGVVVPKNMGKHGIVEVREYSDTLLMFILRASRPNKYREQKVIQDNRQINVLPYDQMIQKLTNNLEGDVDHG
jgi:hypothetical protein